MSDIRYWDWVQGVPKFTKTAAEIRATLPLRSSNPVDAAWEELEQVLKEWTNPELGEPHD